MDETVIGILGTLVALGLLAGIAYALDRRRKTRDKEVNKKDRIIFYASAGLSVGGVLLLGIGALYGSIAVIIIGIVMWICAGGLRWVWRSRKLR
jgi:hypothetical protein